ncbi:MAG: hypothetical protein ABIO23_07880, partial [Chitinophagales bacterium]
MRVEAAMVTSLNSNTRAMRNKFIRYSAYNLHKINLLIRAFVMLAILLLRAATAFTQIPDSNNVTAPSDSSSGINSLTVGDDSIKNQVLPDSSENPYKKGSSSNYYLGDSTITLAASDKYHSNFLGKLILGSHYRKVWGAPITIHYLDMEHMRGGLTPLKRGGGLQTKSLRLMGADSNQYVIRTIDKDPSKTVTAAFQNTILTDLIQDQISASHPYAFLVIPSLAKSANIYHTNPKILYVTDDPGLGKFRDDFKNRMVLFEERILTNADVEEGLSGFRKVKSTFEVYEAIQKNADNYVDEKFLLRSRLFDMWIGDWDRHEDQWLWAEFKQPDGTKMYRPIPRDRDQAFFTFDGVLPTIASLNIAATKKMQRFRPMPRTIEWFNFNARNVDHNLLTRMTQQDWRDMADSMLITISDQNIEDAFRVLPDTIYNLSAPGIIKNLKSRRNNLPLIADDYYRFLSQNVTILGTNKQDYFEVKHSVPDVTNISVYEYKDGVRGKLYYRRTFTQDETRQIQLYGLNANDVFHLEGKASASPVIRIIGGEGIDTITDIARISSLFKKTKVYDTKEGNVLNLGSEARSKTSNDSIFNNYSHHSYDYNHKLFYPYFGYGVDDGVFLGAALSFVSYGFKKGPCAADMPCYNSAPYASKQTIGFDVAMKTRAFNFFYRADFSDVLGKLNLNIDAKVQAPNFRYNFFGFGDTTLLLYPAKDYRLRINSIYLFPSLEAGDLNKVRFQFGPLYTEARVTNDSIAGDTVNIFPDLTQNDFLRKSYIGLNTQWTYDPFIEDSLPKFEIRFKVNVGYLKQVESNDIEFGFARGYVSF